MTGDTINGTKKNSIFYSGWNENTLGIKSSFRMEKKELSPEEVNGFTTFDYNFFEALPIEEREKEYLPNGLRKVF